MGFIKMLEILLQLFLPTGEEISLELAHSIAILWFNSELADGKNQGTGSKTKWMSLWVKETWR